jgi:riboflavin kinase/FMN adenylyltransferase
VKVYHGLESIDPPLVGVTLTIGNFDGVHRGHQKIVAQAALTAQEHDSYAVAVTFDPHPLAVVAPTRAPARLTTIEARVDQLAAAGARAVVVLRSEPALLGLSADEFIDQVIVGKFHPRCIVEGDSFGFGKGRAGNVDLLRERGRALGFEMLIVEPVRMRIGEEQVLVSSSEVRRQVRDGRVARAALCLGRPYDIGGVVTRGAGRGRKIGFPTANLADIPELVPAEGIYAGTAAVDGETFPAAISIGTNPTFDHGHLSVEAHLLEFERDVYDRPMRLSFVRRLRDHAKFDTVEDLIRHIERDCRQVRAIHKAGQ